MGGDEHREEDVEQPADGILPVDDGEGTPVAGTALRRVVGEPSSGEILEGVERFAGDLVIVLGARAARPSDVAELVDAGRRVVGQVSLWAHGHRCHDMFRYSLGPVDVAVADARDRVAVGDVGAEGHVETDLGVLGVPQRAPFGRGLGG